jgi:phosphatidylcholine synthase
VSDRLQEAVAPSLGTRLAGAAVHVYTALGTVVGLLIVLAAIEGEVTTALWLFFVALFIDGTDGMLARRFRVKETIPWFDGARLDDIVDYLTYVFVPVLLMMRAGLLLEPWSFAVAALVLLASAYGFGQTEAKVSTTDYFFTGFPSYWNIVALYMYVWRLPPAVNTLILAALAVLVFVPIRYVYPSRTKTLRMPTLVLGVLWAVGIVVAVWRLPQTDGPWLPLSTVFLVYYVGLSLWLHSRDRSVKIGR